MTLAATDVLGQIVPWFFENVRRLEPYAVHHVVNTRDDEPIAPSDWPAFGNSFDWHSSVHTHWALAEVVRSGSPFAEDAADALRANLTAENIATECDYLEVQPGFEVPYGMCWALHLASSVRHGPLDDLAAVVRPLEALAWERLAAWFDGLPCAVRTGEHSNSAFAMSMTREWAATEGHASALARIDTVARSHHEGEQGPVLHLEPSAYDFLSPGLAAAELMSQVMSAHEFAGWLARALPGLDGQNSPSPVATANRHSGKLVHWDGLNLSRAWMMARISHALPADDVRVGGLAKAADRHGATVEEWLGDATYAGTHWLGSFILKWLFVRAQLGHE